MSEKALDNELVAVGRFLSSVEASLAQTWLAEEGIESRVEGAATANCLSYYGSQIVGAQLWVKHCDLARAQAVLDTIPNQDVQGDLAELDETPPTSPLIRAYRAAILGSILFPPVVVYSLYLVFKHRLWEPHPGEISVNWRFYVTILFQILGLLCFWWIGAQFRS